MNTCTFLGACVNLGVAEYRRRPDSGVPALPTSRGIWRDKSRMRRTRSTKPLAIAHEAGRKRVSLSLTDRFCVDRHHSDFLRLVDHHVDILFANRSEIQALFKTETIDEAVKGVRSLTELAVITLDVEGSLIVSRDAIDSNT